jgi:hypothetical protein
MYFSNLFQFCDLEANLHVRVHAFPCRKVSNLFLLIFVGVLAVSYFVVGQSWWRWGQGESVISILSQKPNLHIRGAVPKDLEPIRIGQRHFWTSQGICFRPVAGDFQLDSLSGEDFQKILSPWSRNPPIHSNILKNYYSCSNYNALKYGSQVGTHEWPKLCIWVLNALKRLEKVWNGLK